MLTRRQARDQKQRLLNAGSNGENNGGKRPASDSPAVQPLKKRSALGDITNDFRNVRIDSSKKQVTAVVTSNSSAPLPSEVASCTAEDSFATIAANSTAPADVSMLSPVDEGNEEEIEEKRRGKTPDSAHLANGVLTFPAGFGIRTEYDLENESDPYHVPHYAQDIFDYYKAREQCFVVGNYMDRQIVLGGVTCQMRAILVDWMVEIQEDFELNHETLYQAVKMTDLYLDKASSINKEMLQLVGTAALLISSKFDERQPPCIDDFLYVCDDAYDRKQLIQMETIMLKVLNFDIGFPLSYRFLRRYAKATKATMETLTLARYILETSLMHYELIQMRDSLIAAASFLLALRMKSNENWGEIHEKYSGYKLQELEPLMWKLNMAIQGTPLTKNLKNVRSKYSHEVFHSVAKLPPLQNPPASL